MVRKKLLRQKPVTKLRLRTKLIYLAVGAGISILLFTIVLLTGNLGTPGQSKANKKTALPGFKYSAKVIVDKKDIDNSNDLYNFRVLVQLEGKDLMPVSYGGKLYSTYASDIMFTKPGGDNVLEHNIKRYNPEKGQLDVWVLVDTLKHDMRNELVFHYGNEDMVKASYHDFWKNLYKVTKHNDSTYAEAPVKDMEIEGV